MNVRDVPAEILTVIGPIHHLASGAPGMTASVIIAETPDGLVALKRAVGALYGGWLTREYRVLSALADGDLPVPHPRAFVRRDDCVVPECWLAMDYLPGMPLATALANERDKARRERLLCAFGSTLALIHRTAPPSSLTRYSAGWLEYMLEEAGENLEHFNVDGSPELLANLRQTRPRPVDERLIHGDYTVDNVLVDGDAVSGVIDWSGGAIGDPRYDLALAIRPQVEAFSKDHADDLDAFFDGYGGRSLSQTEFDYFNGLYEFF
ncbi:MAG: phosphotransferase [Chloroflexi bacterium]|nr:phosphotransferase [Chloroflexota bacterium]MCL5275229.1 phosphotransferase [Chloroflexota bacterium]